MSISLMNDLGIDYFENPTKRIEDMRDNSALCSTGWRWLDDKLFGGFAVGGLNIFLAGSGVGKSLALANISANWVLQGKHVVYISLELSEELIANRFDAMFTGVSTKEVIAKSKEIGLQVKMVGMKTAGSLRIKRLPESSTTANDIRAYLKEYEIRFGHAPDAGRHRLPRLDGAACEDRTIQRLAEGQIRVGGGTLALHGVEAPRRHGVSVQPLARSRPVNSITVMSPVALSKIQTSDIAIGIMAPSTWKENGRMQFQLLKTRTSSGIGAKVEMAYDPISMRINDRAEADVQQESLSPDEMRTQLKAKYNQQGAGVSVEQLASGEVVAKKAGLDIFALMKSTTGRADL